MTASKTDNKSAGCLRFNSCSVERIGGWRKKKKKKVCVIPAWCCWIWIYQSFAKARDACGTAPADEIITWSNKVWTAVTETDTDEKRAAAFWSSLHRDAPRESRAEAERVWMNSTGQSASMWKPANTLRERKDSERNLEKQHRRHQKPSSFCWLSLEK